MNINIINLSKSFNRSQSSNHPISCLDWNPILYKLDEGVQGFAAKRITPIITNQSICLWCFWKTCTKVDMILTRPWYLHFKPKMQLDSWFPCDMIWACCFFFSWIASSMKSTPPKAWVVNEKLGKLRLRLLAIAESWYGLHNSFGLQSCLATVA